MHKIPACLFSVLVGVFCLAWFCPVPCPADTIIGNSPGTPIDGLALADLELADLGINPGAFLFTGNTMYDYNGVYELEIIAAEIDPSLTTSLAGASIQQILVALGDLGNGAANDEIAVQDDENPASSTPEPSSVALCLAGCLFITAASYKVRRMRRQAIPQRAG